MDEVVSYIEEIAVESEKASAGTHATEGAGTSTEKPATGTKPEEKPAEGGAAAAAKPGEDKAGEGDQPPPEPDLKGLYPTMPA